MLRCPELSKLPKAPVFSSINFRRQTPGSATPLLASTHVERLDESHPAIKTNRHAFPHFRHKVFGVTAYPMALLGKPMYMWPAPLGRFIDTWEDRINRAQSARKVASSNDKDLPRISRMVLNNERPGRVPMSLLIATSKKRTSGKKSIRVAITRRLKTTLNLIIARGANVVEVKGKKTIVFKEQDAAKADDWILHGWSYIFFPTLEMYRMPYHDLIPLLRRALRSFQHQGRVMEARWEAQIPRPSFKGSRSLLSRPPLSTRKSWSRRNTDVGGCANDHRLNSAQLSDKRRDLECRSSVEVDLQSKPKKLVTADDVEKASVDFFKKLSQKDITPTRNWSSFLEQDDANNEALDHLKIFALEEESPRKGNTRAPSWARKDPFAQDIPLLPNKVKKNIPNSWKDTVPINTAKHPKGDREELKVQVQEDIRSKLFNRNSVFRPPARPKR